MIHEAMKKILMLLTALAAWCGSAKADGLVVQDISVPQGGMAILEIALENPTTPFAAFQFNIQLAEGITVSTNDKGKFVFERGDRLDEDFSLSMSQPDPNSNTYRVLGYYTETQPIAGTTGTIIRVTIQADASLAVNSSHTCQLTAINLTEPDETKHTPDPISFEVTIDEPDDGRIKLDETSTTAPVASDGEVDVKVKRTIKANEWSTICLPFSMDEDQLKAAFGEDVELAEFDDYEQVKTGDDVTGLIVNFEDVDLAEDGLYANYPYIIRTSKDITTFTVIATIDPNEEDAVAEYTNGKSGPKKVVYGRMKGTLHAGDANPADNIFLNGSKFWYSTGATTIKAFRAYFWFQDVLSGDGEAKLRVTVDNEVVSIEGVGASNIVKGTIYNVNGQLMGTDIDINNLPKGVYMVDGKKVVIY